MSNAQVEADKMIQLWNAMREEKATGVKIGPAKRAYLKGVETMDHSTFLAFQPFLDARVEELMTQREKEAIRRRRSK